MTNSQLVLITSLAHALQVCAFTFLLLFYEKYFELPINYPNYKQRIEASPSVAVIWMQLIAQYSVLRDYRDVPGATPASISLLTGLCMVSDFDCRHKGLI